MDQHETRTRADQHKFLPQLACIKPTLLFVEYYPVFGQFFENEFKNKFVELVEANPLMYNIIKHLR